MKLMGKDAYDVHKTLSNYQFSAVGTDSLDGSEYTIVQIMVDGSCSVMGFKKKLEEAISRVLKSCRQSPRSENLLLRVAEFGTQYKGNIKELHGFTLISNLKDDQYKDALKPSGSTPLYDAALSALESLEIFGGSLVDQDYLVNGIQFVITDGFENSSRCRSADKIKDTVTRIRKEEKLETLQTILIGVDDTHCRSELMQLKDDAGFDEYISLGDVSSSKLAKLAQFVSQSISTTSQSLGTGTAPTQIGFVA